MYDDDYHLINSNYIEINNRQEKNYFDISEFKYVAPHPLLLKTLCLLRKNTNSPIFITANGGSARTIREHIIIYQNIYGKDWAYHIPWKSRHLPKHGTPYLRAVDITSPGITGDRLKCFLLKERMPGVNLGIGVGKYFLHIDIDRNNGNREWTYAK